MPTAGIPNIRSWNDPVMRKKRECWLPYGPCPELDNNDQRTSKTLGMRNKHTTIFRARIT